MLNKPINTYRLLTKQVILKPKAMKKNNLKYFILLGTILSLMSCQKNEIDVTPTKLASVSNLQYVITGDTVVLTWNLPAGYDTLNVTVNDGSATNQLKMNATSYKFGVVETNIPYGLTVKISDTKGNISLGETVRFTRDGAAPVKDPTAVQNDDGVLLSWTLPDKPVTKIHVVFGSYSLDLGPAVTSHQFPIMAAGSYLISIVTTNSEGKQSNSVFLPFKVGATAVAYLGVYSDSTTMLSVADDDEIAGAKWLFQNYAKSRYISFDQVKNGSVDLSQYRVIWWNYDVETGHTLPAIATDASVVSKMTKFYKDGGNLLLSVYAIQYFWTLGRMTDPYFMAFDDGIGGNNPDIWGIGVNIHQKHDQSGHPLYKGITMTTQGDGRITFPVIGAGWKENHNAVVVRIPEFYGMANDDENAYNRFVNDNNIAWLGMWDGIGDYWMCGVMEMKPKADFHGSGLFIGIGGIEFHQNTGNPYQATIEKLYKNAIDYLKTK